MTRKRFVKLLMAEGFSRNGANKIAEDVRKDGLTYAEGYDMVIRLLPLIDSLTKSLPEAIRSATEAISKFATAIGEAAGAFVETFKAAMCRT